jgi:hypothetical protein
MPSWRQQALIEASAEKVCRCVCDPVRYAVLRSVLGATRARA